MIPESQVGGYDGVGEMPYYKPDPAAAKKLLAEAGYPDGIDLGNYIVVAANPLDVACAQILQQQWPEAGITVEITPMETAPLLDMWGRGVCRHCYPSRCLGPRMPMRSCRESCPATLRQGDGHRGPGTRQDDRRSARRSRSGQARRRQHADPATYRRKCVCHPDLPVSAALGNLVELRQGLRAACANIRSYVRTTWVEKWMASARRRTAGVAP